MLLISEVFSKLSCDLIGPLPKSNKENKYMLSAVCTYSRYPEAIPILNMLSEIVIDALTLVFSRLGYPLELQTDLGKSFTSNLNTVFKRLLKVLSVENGSDREVNLPHALLA